MEGNGLNGHKKSSILYIYDDSPIVKDGMDPLFDPNVDKNFSIYFGHENWSIVLYMMLGIR